MKILQVINNIGWGGAGNLLLNFVPIIHNRGYNVEILFIQRANSPHIKILEEQGIKVSCLSENTLYNPFFIFKIRNFIKRGKYDIVHVHLFPALYYVGLAAYLGLGKYKLLFTEHNTTNKRMNNNVLFTIVDKIIYRKYDTIACITPQVQKNITKHLKGIKCNFITVLNGIDLNKFNSKIKINKLDLFDGYKINDVLVVMVARFCSQKDQQTLIKAIALLEPNIHLLLLGEGETKKECIELTRFLKIENRVHFLGVRNDVPDVLRLCDIGVLSSNYEGMPIAAMEIMAAGIPFIGSRVPGIQDLVETDNNKAGILFNQGDEIELADIINKLLTDNIFYQEVASECKKKALDFSIEKMVDGYIDAYKNGNNN